MLSFLIKPFAYLFSAFSFIWLLMRSAKNEGASTEKVKHLQEAARANKQANDARRASSNDSERGRLRDDDGFRRD